MQHLDEGFLHALADGEVPSAELAPVREHLEGCAACRARLEEARLEAETARELVELIEVPDGRTDRRTDGPRASPAGRWGGRHRVRTVAWAASLVLAAGIGYYGRNRSIAPAAELAGSTFRDTVFMPAAPATNAPRQNEAAADAVAPTPTAPARQQAAQEITGKRTESSRDRDMRLDDVVATVAQPPAEAERKEADRKDESAKLGAANVRQRAAADTREESNASLARKAAVPAAAPPTPPIASALEGRVMARSGEDANAVPVTFPRAVELLGGRLRLIEGMVPSRLEAVGRLVRVVYVLDEGELVLAQFGGADSVFWGLAGPLGADSLARLRLRVR